jgi:hypothetical protein
MMAQQSDFLWELPDLSDIADGPDAFLQFADGIAGTIKDRSLSSYTPLWSSDGAAQPVNTSKREGFYRIDHGVCTFNAHLFFGPSTNGGSGRLFIGLPVPGSSSITTQHISAHLWTPTASAVWHGAAYIDTPSRNVARPYFPVNNARSDMLQWASALGDFGLSVPQIPSNPGGWSVMNGGDIALHGSYFVA